MSCDKGHENKKTPYKSYWKKLWGPIFNQLSDEKLKMNKKNSIFKKGPKNDLR
jgi:hypothetical protein